MRAVIYDLVTGEITRTITAPSSHIAIQCGEGESYAISNTAGDETHYFNTELAAIQPKADYTQDALPLPCTVTIEGVEYVCTEQPTFTFNYPGTYKIEVDAGVRYLKKEFEVVWT